MKKFTLSATLSLLLIQATVGICNPKKQHCFQPSMREPMTLVDNKYFNSDMDCGLNLDAIRKCSDPFCRAVIDYTATKSKLMEAVSKGDMKEVETEKTKLSNLKTALVSTGLTPEQVFNIPEGSHSACQSLKKKKLESVAHGQVKKALYRGKYPPQDVFEEGNHMKFDFCKIDKIVRAERGATPQISNGVAQGLKLYAGNKEKISQLEKMPKNEIFTEMVKGFKEKRQEYITDFGAIGISEEQLETLPPTPEMEAHIKEHCNK